MAVAIAEWGRAHGKGPAGKKLRNECVVHTEAGAAISPDATRAGEQTRMRAIEEFHTRPKSQGGRGWVAIAYSFVVAPSGRAYEGRGWGRDGSHTQQGRNQTAYAICFMGNGDTTAATEGAWAAAQAIVREGLREGYVKPSYVVNGHRNYAPKSCPGNLIYPYIGRLRGLTAIPPTPQEDDMLTLVKVPDSPGAPNKIYAVDGLTARWIGDPKTIDAYVRAGICKPLAAGAVVSWAQLTDGITVVEQ